MRIAASYLSRSLSFYLHTYLSLSIHVSIYICIIHTHVSLGLCMHAPLQEAGKTKTVETPGRYHA